SKNTAENFENKERLAKFRYQFTFIYEKNLTRMKHIGLLLGILLLTFSSCSKKKMESLQSEFKQHKANCINKLAKAEEEKEGLRANMQTVQRDLDLCREALKNEQGKNKNLGDQVDYMKKTNGNLLDQMSQLSVISKTGAESIQKSLEAMNSQSEYIKDLNKNLNRKDSTNLALVMNLKRSLGNINDEDVTIEVKKGVVYVSLSDKMLFNSGSWQVLPRAHEVLSKIAKVVNDHRELDLLVEGHTDNMPISNSCVTDNWDLSVKRATAVVRILQNRYSVLPSRMTAGGRSEYVPKTSNDSVYSRGINRRTEIIILPKLDEFFELNTLPEGGR
ncbi:MAG: OmpA family protein, partial [Chitinophagales bacterium]